MGKEHDIQNSIREALSKSCVVFRMNVGKIRTPDGRFFDTGVPAGFSDLFGFRKSDGRAFFIEVKRPHMKASDKQKAFLEKMQSYGAIAGICYSAEDAINLVTKE